MAPSKDDIKLIGLQSSQVLSVREFTPIGECIEVMARRNIGCVVVIGGPTEDALVGIFTERDLLKHYSKISQPDHVDYPVRDFMSSPVVTLPVGKLFEAAQLMIERGFRHVVFTIPGKGGHELVAGVVSIRDVLHEMFRGQSLSLSSLAKVCPEVVLVSGSEDSRRLFREIFDRLPETTLHTLDPTSEKLMKDLEGAQRLFFDIDRQGDWAALLRKIIAMKKKPEKIALLFNPLAHTQPALRTLEKIAEAKVFQIFEKPVGVSQVLDLARADP
jgi:CBS domain-containing protein